MKHCLLLAVILLASCAEEGVEHSEDYPLPVRSVVSDASASGPKRGLQDLLLTLPVFELAPEERQKWVSDNSQPIPGGIRVEGDGAQSTLEFIYLGTPGDYNLKIEAPEDQRVSSYRLKRLEAGWFVLERSSS